MQEPISNHSDPAEGAINEALVLLDRATGTMDGRRLSLYCVAIAQLLAPHQDPTTGHAKAVFLMGVLAQRMAHKMLVNPLMVAEEQLRAAYMFFQKAGDYFGKASEMPDRAKDLSPAWAMDALAMLYEDGVLGDGEKDLPRAYALRERASDAGFAEAQMNLAIQLYRGEGCAPDLPKALSYARLAWGNRTQLTPSLRNDLARMCKKLSYENRGFPTRRDPPLKEARVAAKL